jgi:hypothetical protein
VKLFLHFSINFSLCTPWRRLGGVNILMHSFLTSALDDVSSQCYAQIALPPRKEPPVLCGSKNQSGRFGEEINVVPLLVIERRRLGCLSRSLVTIATELPHLLQHTSFVIQLSTGAAHVSAALRCCLLEAAVLSLWTWSAFRNCLTVGFLKGSLVPT